MSDDLDFGATLRGFSAGQKVFKRYTLAKILGRGGMGIVWLARDEELERDVALKFLPEVVAADKQAISDLKRETRRSLELTHQHIIRIYDFLQDATTAAISMEFVAGDTLAALKLEQARGHFEVPQLQKWMEQLGQALDYAHTVPQIVHRDLKPANLMIDVRGDLKVADFGIAASVSDSVSRVSVQAGSSGTPVYMSPQQMMGERPAVTDDVYAFGATLYELLTGRPPFYSGNIVAQVQGKQPPSMTERRAELETVGEEIPPRWEQTVAACLAKEPHDRPRSVAEVMDRLAGNGPTPSLAEPTSADPGIASAPAESVGPISDDGQAKPQLVPRQTGRAGKRFAIFFVILIGLTAGGIKYHNFQEAQAVKARVARGELEVFVTNRPGSGEVVEGRNLEAGDFAYGADPVAVVEASARRSLFGDDSSLVGSEITLSDGRDPATVVGVVNWGKGVELILPERRTEPTADDFRKVMGHNLHQLSAAANRYFLENGADTVTVDQLVGSPNDLRRLIPLPGVDYAMIGSIRQGAPLELTTADGTRYRYDHPNLTVKTAQEVAGIILSNLRQLAAAADQYFSENGGYEVAVDQLVGPQPGKYIRTLNPVVGENYGAIGIIRRDRNFAVSTPDHVLYTYHTEKGNLQVERPSTFHGGQPFENGLGMRFVAVPGTPVHFSIWETRVQDFAAFVQATGYDATRGMYSYRTAGEHGNETWGQHGDTWQSPGFPQGPTHPVVGVSVDDANAFCVWLTQKEQREGRLPPDRVYRLPEYNEWGRAAGTSKFPWGETWPPPRGAGNYADEAAKRLLFTDWAVIPGYDDGYAGTAPVGSFAPNRYGLYDLGGNAWDRVQRNRGGEDWLRGSSFAGDRQDRLRSGFMSKYSSRVYSIGFRVVIAPR